MSELFAIKVMRDGEDLGVVLLQGIPSVGDRVKVGGKWLKVGRVNWTEAGMSGCGVTLDVREP